MTGVSGLWSMTLVGGSGMISEWLTDPGMLVVRLLAYAKVRFTCQKTGHNPTMAPAAKV